MYVWGAAQRGVPMQVNVIGTLMFLISLAIVLAWSQLRRGARALAVADEGGLAERRA